MPEQYAVDGLLPPEIASKAEDVGVKKAQTPLLKTFWLALLAGAFIALGAIFCTVVITGASPTIPYGLVKLLGGVVFCLGLILVIVGGAELFTGNNLLVMAWVSRKVSLVSVLRNWAVVYIGNFVASIVMACMMFLTAQYLAADGQVGVTALKIANAKCELPFMEALTRGIFCNVLVCLAVWLTFSCRTTGDKILAIIFPITAFVAAGFEHCVANMYFIPIGMMIKWLATPEFWAITGTSPGDFAGISVTGFLWTNLAPVTLGNIIGGAVFVGANYWLIYHRREEAASG